MENLKSLICKFYWTQNSELIHQAPFEIFDQLAEG